MGEHEHVHRESHAAPAASKAAKPAGASVPLLQLQRLAGNAAVSGLVAQRQEENLPTQSGGGGGGLTTFVSMSKQSLTDIKLQNGSVIDASFNTQ